MAESHIPEIEIMSREMVKPSSPTPPHLQTLKLSSLDQISQSMYVSILFFYHTIHADLASASQRLTQSLSHALTSFYPLAGRLLDCSTVHCNDAGAELTIARVLGDVAWDPRESERYLPAGPTVQSSPLFLAQVNFFPSRGVAIGVRFSHNVADCASATAFLEEWAAIGRGNRSGRSVSFNLWSYFPAREELRARSLLPRTEKDHCCTKSFAFDKTKLEALSRRVAASSGGLVGRTQVELVSAFIWESYLQASSSSRKVVMASHVVNLRRRKKAFENIFGNCLMVSYAHNSSGGKGRELHELAGKLRESIRKVDESYINGSENGGTVYFGDSVKVLAMLMKGEMELCLFSSWCHFPIHEIDFGWGKPVRVCPADLPLKNLTVLMDMNGGKKGIEAWVNTTEDRLQILEKNFESICGGDTKDDA